MGQLAQTKAGPVRAGCPGLCLVPFCLEGLQGWRAPGFAGQPVWRSQEGTRDEGEEGRRERREKGRERE